MRAFYLSKKEIFPHAIYKERGVVLEHCIKQIKFLCLVLNTYYVIKVRKDKGGLILIINEDPLFFNCYPVQTRVTVFFGYYKDKHGDTDVFVSRLDPDIQRQQ